MLSLRRLAYVLILVIGLSIIFLIYNINEKNTKVVTIENTVIEEKPLEQGIIAENSDEVTFYLVGNPAREIYGDIYNNISRMMDDMKLSWEAKIRIQGEDLSNLNHVIIFCDDEVNPYVDQRELGYFIEKGGKVVLAAGLAEGYKDSYLLPVWGVVEKTIRTNYTDYNFLKPFLPVQEEKMSYDGYTMSTRISVREEAQVYVEDAKKKVPLVYSYAYGQGKSLILNTTILSNQKFMGFLSSGLGVLLEDFVYPVLGVESIFIDNFPIISQANDSYYMKSYGHTTEAFIRDVIWPVFQGMALRNDLKYTSSVVSIASDDEQFPKISSELFGAMGKSALQFNGELAYASQSIKSNKHFKNEKFLTNFDQIFRNYTISSLVMMADMAVEETLSILDKDINVIRGSLVSNNQKERLSLEEDYYVFPNATSGVELDRGLVLEIASVYSAYGMISHTLDFNNFMGITEGKPTWDEDRIKLSKFEDRVLRPFKGLEKITLSETINAIRSYKNLEYSWNNDGETISITADQFVIDQPFLVRTNDKINSVEGATIEKIGDNYYMVRLTASKAILGIAKGE